MSNKRINLKQFEDLQHSWRTRSGIYDELFSHWICDRKEEIMAELKKMYAREDELLQAIDGWGMVICPRSGEWFEWDYGCQSESCVDKEDCRELVEQQQASE